MAQRKPPWTHSSIFSRLLLTGIALLCFTFALHAAPATEPTPKPDVEAQARSAQKSGRWLEAVRLYDEVLHGKEKPSAEARESYQECLRRYYLQRRHGDKLYREALAKVDYQDAEKVLEKVLETLSQNYFDAQKVEPGVLFRNGMQELIYALDEDAFTKQYLTTGDKKQLEPLRQRLNELMAQKAVISRKDARDDVLSLSRDACQLRLSANNVRRTFVVFALEFVCGACNALDEYSLYLTPFHLNALRGKYVGVGVDLAIIDHNLVITRIYPNSPAADAMAMNQLAVGDRVKKIDSLPVDDLPPDVVAERLLGEADTEIELELQAPGEMKSRNPFKLVRRAVAMASVEHRMVGDSMMSGMQDIGYIRIYSFQDKTPQHVKEALIDLQSLGMKGLILDLRGNPGGLFKAAVEVSELFLNEGTVIVFTQGQLKQFSKPYKVEGGNPFQGPVMVLVDGDTASSAEILAGALKDHNRAKLFGQPTFGKGSIQEIIPLERTSGGIRITVAKFMSPLKQAVSGTGIMPHVIVVDNDSDETYAKALDELRGLLKMSMMR
jgi:carboxyl-terminal processing protease